MGIKLAIDPGPERTALIVYKSKKGQPPQIASVLLGSNEAVLETVRNYVYEIGVDKVSIEMVQSYGMAVGRSVFETCLMIGRFIEIAAEHSVPCSLYTRVSVKSYVTGMSGKAKDPHVRAACIDRYGLNSEKKGGVLADIKKDLWAALALAIYENDGAVLGAW
jgi:Holliday junction resolvasome RuvABC endonuclease subunit